MNVMPIGVFKTLWENTKKPKQTSTTLTAYGANKINVLGCCGLKGRYRKRVHLAH